MDSANIPTGETSIPEFLENVKAAYGLEDVPVNLEVSHPLFDIWQKRVQVESGSAPDPIHTAKGDMSDQFPFNFAESLVLDAAEDFSFLSNIGPDPPKVVMALKIDVFRPAPNPENRRGIKVTVFSVPQSEAHPNGVIVKRGLEFVDKAGNLVADDVSTERIPEESVVPSEAVSDIPLV